MSEMTEEELAEVEGRTDHVRTLDAKYQAWKTQWPGAPRPMLKEQRADLLAHITFLQSRLAEQAERLERAENTYEA